MHKMGPAYPSRTLPTIYAMLLLAALPCTLCLKVRLNKGTSDQQGMLVTLSCMTPDLSSAPEQRLLHTCKAEPGALCKLQ